MELEVTAELGTVWKQTLAQLSGAARRMFMASVVKGLGRGGARQAQIQLGWDSENLKITNDPDANKLLHYEYRKGWNL